MKRIISAVLLGSIGVTIHAADPSFSEIEPLLESYCYKCHDGDVSKGEFRLDTYASLGDVIRDRKHWLKVLEQLETREMPTKNPLPSEAEYEKMITWVDRAVNDVDWEKYKHPGHVTLPRLTNVEYDRTIRDLLGIDIEASRIFSADGEGKSGFTNDRDNLFLSSSQLEKYFTAAEWAIDTLAGLRTKPGVQHFEAEKMFMTESRTAISTFPDKSQGFVLNRGQMTLYESVSAPHRGIYEFRVRMSSTKSGRAGLLLRINDQIEGELETEGQAMKEVVLPVFLNPGNHQMAWNFKPYPKAKQPGQKNNKKKNSYTRLPPDANKIISRESQIRAPRLSLTEKESQNGKLKSLVLHWNRAELGVQRAYEWLRLHGKDGDPRELLRFRRYVNERSQALDPLDDRIAGLRGISLEEFHREYKNANQKQIADRANLTTMAKAENVPTSPESGLPRIDWIKLSGPILPRDSRWPDLARNSSLALQDEKTWTTWYPDFLERSFRRELREGESNRYEKVYLDTKSSGATHYEAARKVLLAVLVSPNFLYRSEEISTGEVAEPFQLDSRQLASRLSYFLWQSMPDSELSSTDLTNPQNRTKQVTRMLQDWRADIFFKSFPGQWLGYEALGKSVLPDAKRFPQFSSDLAEDMKTETQLWFEEIFRNNRPLTDLLRSGETFLNQDLARHYGIDGVGSDSFELVSLTEKDRTRRGGLLGMGSVLTATSPPTRTSPVLRGVFVLERLLGVDPGKPPADAGELPGNAGGRGKTLREELALHRDAEACAACHDKIDPIGFGLDHFDAVGRYRETEGKKPIDASGELPDGTKFNGVDDLRNYILNKRSDEFARIVVERLLSYALGRELRTYDEPAIVRILKTTKPEGYRAAHVVDTIVASYPFQNQHPAAEWNP